MKINIPNSYEPLFTLYILDSMKSWYRHHINPEKLIVFQNYIDAEPSYKSIYVKHYDLQKLLLSAVENIKVTKYPSMYEISLDGLLPVYGLRNVYLDEFVRLVNNGALGLQPYPIFSEMFNYFQNNLEKLYNEWRSV